jgi:hypothetical protein
VDGTIAIVSGYSALTKSHFPPSDTAFNELPGAVRQSEANSSPPPVGGVVTVIAAVPVTPLVAAPIVVLPAATPLTTPLEFTVATAVLLLVQVNVWPEMMLPLPSRAVAVSWIVLPACTLAGVGVTDTLATVCTGAVMVRAAVPD